MIKLNYLSGKDKYYMISLIHEIWKNNTNGETENNTDLETHT